MTSICHKTTSNSWEFKIKIGQLPLCEPLIIGFAVKGMAHLG